MSTPQVPAARNALAILKLLSGIDVPVSASRIQAELGLPRSSTYQLLKAMVQEGFVVHIPENQTYGLGLAAYAMAQAYSTQQPLVRMVTKDLQAAATLVGGSGHLSRLSGSEVVYLQEVRTPGAMSLLTDKGVRLQAHKTASGRAMMALLPAPEARAVYVFNGGGSHWREMENRLQEVRARGWETETEEVSRGQASIAVAIADHLGRPAAALAVTYSISAVDRASREQALGRLVAAASAAQSKMYGN